MKHRMHQHSHRGAALLAAAGLAASAVAQESVPAGGAATDALDPYDTSVQVVPFVVDLNTQISSFGNEFGLAPILKSSLGSPDFENAVISAQGISRDMLVEAPFAASEYALWENASGAGVNPQANTEPGSIAAPSSGNQLGVVFAEFDESMNNIMGALINWDPADPTRLFINRTAAALNANSFGGNQAQFGAGAADASGNVTWRADDFAVPSGGSSVSGNNIFRVDMRTRSNGALNVISGSGGSDASTDTDQLIFSSSTAHNAPNSIPESIAGRPVYAGSNFNNQYVFESAPNVTSVTTAHKAGLGDHRGNVSFSTSSIFSNSIATAGVLAKASTQTDSMALWGVDASGAVTGNIGLTLPLNVTDPIDPFTYVQLTTDDPFNHYKSQVAFRGGNGQIAIGEDQEGRGLAGAVAYIVGGTDDPSNAIPVARFTEGGAPEWTLAAWIEGRPDPDGDGIPMWPQGKPILDASGAAIGELTTLFQVTEPQMAGSGETRPFGPSVSAPAIDSVGNIWFLSAVQLFEGDNDDLLPFDGNDRPSGGDDIYTTALIRAVYDAESFGYRLELVVKVGDSFVGKNSGEPYTIVFMEIADSGSVSSGTFFSGNATQAAANGIDPAGLETSDPRTMGGLVVNAAVEYENVQQSYNTLLFLGPKGGVSPPCPGNLNDDDIVDGADLGRLLLAWSPQDNSAPGNPADLNGDNKVDGADLGVLLLAWGPCP